MSDEINLILPGDKRMEEPIPESGVTKEQLLAADTAMIQARIQKEAQKYEGIVEGTINTEVDPYKDDAPLCEHFSGMTSVTEMTEHLGQGGGPGPIQLPRWTHGRCIGSECGRFKVVGGKPICGQALQDLAAAKAVGSLKKADIDLEFARWAYSEDPAGESEE